jgi:hypothetical protein
MQNNGHFVLFPWRLENPKQDCGSLYCNQFPLQQGLQVQLHRRVDMQWPRGHVLKPGQVRDGSGYLANAPFVDGLPVSACQGVSGSVSVLH